MRGQGSPNALKRALPEKHRHFLKASERTFTCGDFHFVHAGVRPGIPLGQQSEEDLLWIREDFLIHEEQFEKIIVHGHTPVMDPDIRPNRINIDTGAFATGHLTCLVLEGQTLADHSNLTEFRSRCVPVNHLMRSWLHRDRPCIVSQWRALMSGRPASKRNPR